MADYAVQTNLVRFVSGVEGSLAVGHNRYVIKATRSCIAVFGISVYSECNVHQNKQTNIHVQTAFYSFQNAPNQRNNKTIKNPTDSRYTNSIHIRLGIICYHQQTSFAN